MLCHCDSNWDTVTVGTIAPGRREHRQYRQNLDGVITVEAKTEMKVSGQAAARKGSSAGLSDKAGPDKTQDWQRDKTISNQPSGVEGKG
jgi:hypothetical protein